MFIDVARIYVKAGNGGNGKIAFHREKYVEKGGPSGGNGGKGGDIVFVADSGLNTLIDYKYKKKAIAPNGGDGGIEKMSGRGADNVYLKVPVGTVIIDDNTGEVLADLTENKQEVTLLKGGRGGRGNFMFLSNKNQAPNFSENGELGKELYLKLELKLLADVGLVGFPSVGKSTLLSRVSAARPEIASYHFTTLKPILGVVKVADDSFVMADLPGLIEGASEGKGLGLRFLKHIERCKVIIHVIDMASSEGRDPYEDYKIIMNELKSYGMKLEDRPMVIAANKMDDEGAILILEDFKEKTKDDNLEIFPISALTNEGLDKMLYRVNELVKTTPTIELYTKQDLVKVYKFEEEKEIFHVVREGQNVFRVEGEEIERMVHATNFQTDEGMFKFLSLIQKLGIEDKLKEKGIQDGDTVKIVDFEFDYYE